MRVAVISSGLVRLPPVRGGAVEEYVYQLVRHLRILGIDAIAIDSSSGKRIEFEEINGAQIVRIPVNELNAPKEMILREYLFGLRVSRFLKDFNTDIIHANTAWAGFALASKMVDIPIVYTCHNGLWPEDKVHASEYVVRFVEGYTMWRSRAIIAINETMKRSIIRKAHVDPRKIFVVPNGVDTEFFKPGISADDVIKRYGLEGKRVILFVGRVTHMKGVHLLLKAFKELALRYSDLKLVVVGPLTDHFEYTEPSPYAKALIEYAGKALPRDSYVFTGPLNHETLRKLYSTAYVCVLPSYAEAFGMVLIEALSSGCPVIGSRAGGTPDIIMHCMNGLLFNKGDWLDLLDKLTILVNDRSLRNKLAENARKIAEELYSWRTVAFRLRNLYNQVLS